MAITEVNIRNFRNDLRKLLDQVDAGVTLVISRGGNKRYTLLPVSEEDLDLTPEIRHKIDKAMDDIRQGGGTRLKGISGIRDFFNNLE